jgi:site-specific recombinase XerD
MSALAPTLQAFFTERLIGQRQASPNTIAAYRDALRLLVTYVADRTGKSPVMLDFSDLDAQMIGDFLVHLEEERGASVTTRNARLAAVHSLFGFAAFRHPEHAELIARVLSIQAKRGTRALVSFLTRPETEALLNAPDRSKATGRRDYVLLALDLQSGLRVSELTGLRRKDVMLGRGPHVRVEGKGRKQRAVPLTSETVALLGSWLDDKSGGKEDHIFPGPSRERLGRDAVRKLVVRNVRSAAATCPSLADKRVGTHTLRHYVDGWVMWPAGVFAVVGVSRGSVPAT